MAPAVCAPKHLQHRMQAPEKPDPNAPRRQPHSTQLPSLPHLRPGFYHHPRPNLQVAAPGPQVRSLAGVRELGPVLQPRKLRLVPGPRQLGPMLGQLGPLLSPELRVVREAQQHAQTVHSPLTAPTQTMMTPPTTSRQHATCQPLETERSEYRLRSAPTRRDRDGPRTAWGGIRAAAWRRELGTATRLPDWPHTCGTASCGSTAH